RSTRDWSSDVCSSDLESLLLRFVDETVRGDELNRVRVDEKKLTAEIEHIDTNRDLGRFALRRLFPEGIPADEQFWHRLSNLQFRSEERRVGKECCCSE